MKKFIRRIFDYLMKDAVKDGLHFAERLGRSMRSSKNEYVFVHIGDFEGTPTYILIKKSK